MNNALINNGQARAAIVAEAMTWLRTPYHHCARVLGVGVDCAMLLAEVYEATGHAPRVEPGPYAPQWHLHRTEEVLLGYVRRHFEPTETPQPGDVVLYRFGRCFSHAAIVVAWPQVIHAAMRNHQVMLDDGNAGDYAPPRERLFFTPKGLA